MAKAPYLVEVAAKFHGGWLSIDDKAWITRNVFDAEAPLSDVRIAHLNPETGENCRDSGGSIGRHTLVSREPLTITPSLACNACSWHGFVTAGRWVPA